MIMRGGGGEASIHLRSVEGVIGMIEETIRGTSSVIVIHHFRESESSCQNIPWEGENPKKCHLYWK